MKSPKVLRICRKGHKFHKSSLCPTCPVCEKEKEKEPAQGFLALLANPARNTLLHHGIDTIKKLSSYTEKEILNLHGMGKASLPSLHQSLEKQGLSFKPESKIKAGKETHKKDKPKNSGGWYTCSRGHKYRGKGPCPVCWPNKKKMH